MSVTTTRWPAGDAAATSWNDLLPGVARFGASGYSEQEAALRALIEAAAGYGALPHVIRVTPDTDTASDTVPDTFPESVPDIVFADHHRSTRAGCRVGGVPRRGGFVISRRLRHEPPPSASDVLAQALRQISDAILASHHTGDNSSEPALADDLAVMQAVDHAKTLLEWHQVQSLARMHATAEQLVRDLPGGGIASVLTAHEVVICEVLPATGASARQTGQRLDFAIAEPERAGWLREQVRLGRVPLERAVRVFWDTRLLDPEAATAVHKSVFGDTRDGSALSWALMNERCRRGILKADSDARTRRRVSRCTHGVQVQFNDDGTGTLFITNDATKVAAAYDRADAAARAVRQRGDGRTLDQLRADFLTGAAINGWPAHHGPTCPLQEPATGKHSSSNGPGPGGGHDDRRASGADPSSADPNADPKAGSRADTSDPSGSHPSAGSNSDSRAHTSADGDGAASHECRCGASGLLASMEPTAPGRAWIVVPVTTMMGLDDAACEMPGHGWIAAEHARAAISTPGSIWQTLVADIDTGRARHLSAKGYRPTAAMVAHVRAVDGTCRGPGCMVRASQCQLDHVIRWPEGATDVVNLILSHGLHHHLKTAGLWCVEHDPQSRNVTWRTAAGRRYTTSPKDWFENVRPTSATSATSATSSEPMDATAPAPTPTDATAPAPTPTDATAPAPTPTDATAPAPTPTGGHAPAPAHSGAERYESALHPVAPKEQQPPDNPPPF